MSAAEPAKKCEKGAPAWVMTFADLMSLLMCFFVLLLSFSEMDVIKYKQVAGSLEEAFGVQREIEVKSMPKGTSVVAKEFSPGKPTPTPINDVRQSTTDEFKQNLDFTDSEHKGKGREVSPEAQAEVNPQALLIAEKLKDEVSQGLLDVERAPGETLIRIQEKGSFPSGSADLTPRFQPIIKKIAEALDATEGSIYVSGHTDDIPISTRRFRSNWELSAARAVTVVHQILNHAELDQTRFRIEGHADASPLVPNVSTEDRARNRRVEIVVRNPDSDAETSDGTPAAIEQSAVEDGAPALDATTVSEAEDTA
jgi:chemotaxis protein MotB